MLVEPRLTTPSGKLRPVDNRQIAERLESFASLLELADANPYTARAYRRAAETLQDFRF